MEFASQKCNLLVSVSCLVDLFHDVSSLVHQHKFVDFALFVGTVFFFRIRNGKCNFLL